MIADMDHLKQINDQCGPATGDAVLIKVSRRLNINLRAVDLVARIGGGEFLIILPKTRQNEAETARKRLCQLIHDTPIKLPNEDFQAQLALVSKWP